MAFASPDFTEAINSFTASSGVAYVFCFASAASAIDAAPSMETKVIVPIARESAIANPA